MWELFLFSHQPCNCPAMEIFVWWGYFNHLRNLKIYILKIMYLSSLLNFTQFQDANWVSTFPLYFLTEMQAASWVRTAAAATRAPPPSSSAGLDCWGMLKGETQCCTELHRINSIATINLVPQEMATSQAERWLRKSVTSLWRRVTLHWRDTAVPPWGLRCMGANRTGCS